MKKALALLLGMTLCVGLFAGCGTTQGGGTTQSSQPAQTEGQTPATETPAAETVTGTVNTNGSTSMESVVGSLAEAFMAQNGGITVNYSPTGSGTGIQAIIDGTCDIGLSSRALKDEEKEQGAVENIVALDVVALVVNPENSVTDLSVEQIAQIFTGEITNWSELGGADGEIAVIGREAGSGTRGAFEEIVGVEDACAYRNELTSTGDVIANVASNPNAIGYASLSAVDETVKAVMVDGVAPSEETVQDGTYAIQRPFVMVTKEGGELSPAAQAFLDYAMSADVAQIIKDAGAVPPVK